MYWASYQKISCLNIVFFVSAEDNLQGSREVIGLEQFFGYFASLLAVMNVLGFISINKLSEYCFVCYLLRK